MPLNVGLIGYGKSTKIFHIPYIEATEGLIIQAICQRSPTPDNDAGKDHPKATIYNDAAALIRAPDIDIVIICTPVATHFQLGKQCLEARKHVVVEKPFCPTAAECEDLIATAKAHNKTLSVFQNRRWDADFQTVLSLLREEKLGRILEFESHFDRWNPTVEDVWQNADALGHGALYEIGSHQIDQTVFAFGMPERVTAVTAKQREGSEGLSHDTFTVLLHYPRMLATLKSSFISAEAYQLRFWIRGTKGSFKKYHEDPQEVQLLSGMTRESPSFGKEAASKYGVLTTVGKDGEMEGKSVPTLQPETYLAFYRQLEKALRDGSKVPVDGRNGWRIIYLIELALKSAREGRTIDVKLDD